MSSLKNTNNVQVPDDWDQLVLEDLMKGKKIILGMVPKIASLRKQEAGNVSRSMPKDTRYVSPTMKKTRLCRSVIGPDGMYNQHHVPCKYGGKCTFAHSPSDIGSDVKVVSDSVQMKKTRLCRSVIGDDGMYNSLLAPCKYGDKCTFAHSPSDIGSDIGVKIPCRSILNGQKCTWGLKCRFDHDVVVKASVSDYKVGVVVRIE